MNTVSVADLMDLSVAERIQLAADLWDSVAVSSPESIPLTDAQCAELDRRLADYDAHPNAGSSWDEVAARIIKDSVPTQ